jgi:uncharacterized protein (DUF1501 family)
MTPNRRDALKTGGMVAWGLSVPAFLTRTALAAPNAKKPGAKDTILVVIELTGGNDGINTVVPYKDPEYAKLRPTLKFSGTQVKKVNDEIGLHPSLTGLHELLEKGNVGIVQGVGYPNPTQSHFRSMDIWQAASTADQLTEGWLGRALKSMPGAPSFHLANGDQRAPLAVEGAPAKVPSITTLEAFQLQLAAATGADKKEQREVIEAAVKEGQKKPGLLDFVSRTSANTYASSRRLQEIGKNYQPKTPFPQNNNLANRLRLAAQLIDADLGARVFYVSLENFDTHAGQAPAHASLLTQLSGALTAFYKEMEARGHGGRVLAMTFSEFGRRAKENGSKGTDHGAAAPMFLVGGKVKSGLIGKHPSLTDLEFGNVKFHTDFRQVYAAILDKWLGVSSKDVLGKEFAHADIFKS